MNDRWETAIPAPAVLVHRQGVHPSSGFNCSYRLVGKNESGSAVHALGVGDYWENGSASIIYHEYIKVLVRRIDPDNQEAEIEIVFRPAQEPPFVGPGIIIGGVAVDGGGYIWLRGKGLVKVPPRSPLLGIME
jgi:hypothetical protein